MLNRRKYIRFKTSLDAKCFSLNGDPVSDHVQITNLSREGVRFTAKETLKKGDRVSLEVSLPGEEEKFPVAAEVTWAVFGNGICNAGVQFKYIDPISRFKMIDYAFYMATDSA